MIKRWISVGRRGMGEWSNDGELREGKEEGAVGAVGWTARAEVG
jgi:hypothetical protein